MLCCSFIGCTCKKGVPSAVGFIGCTCKHVKNPMAFILAYSKGNNLSACSTTQKVKLPNGINNLLLTPQKNAVLAAPDPNLKVLLHSHSKLTLVSLLEVQETVRITIELQGI